MNINRIQNTSISTHLIRGIISLPISQVKQLYFYLRNKNSSYFPLNKVNSFKQILMDVAATGTCLQNENNRFRKSDQSVYSVSILNKHI